MTHSTWHIENASDPMKDAQHFIGRIDCKAIFPAKNAPKASPEEWGLWLLANNLDRIPATDTLLRNTLLSNDMFCALPEALSFVPMNFESHRLPVSDTQLLWMNSSFYDSESGEKILDFKMLCPEPKHFQYQTLLAQCRDVRDIKHAERNSMSLRIALLVGTLRGLAKTQKSKTAWIAPFRLLNVLHALKLPDERAFPNQAKDSGWANLFPMQDYAYAPSSLQAAFDLGLALPDRLFQPTGITSGLLLKDRDNAYNDMPATVFAQHLVDLAIECDDFLAQLHPKIAQKPNQMPDLSGFTGHERLELAYLHDTILELGAQTGAI